MSTEEPVSTEDRPPAARRLRSWAIPLAAVAAALVLVPPSLVAVRQLSTPTTTATTSATVPRYYAALGLQPTNLQQIGSTPTLSLAFGGLIVGDDRTGKAIATVNPPHGLYFDKVQGGSDNRTFVVEGVSLKLIDGPPDTWYLLRIAPGAVHPYQLTKLPIKLPSSPDGFVYALSPDDSELAMESLTRIQSGFATTLALYSVSSGAELRAWTTSEFIELSPGQRTLSWLSDGRQLAFSVSPPGAGQGGSPAMQLRILDVTGSGTDLINASSALLTIGNQNSTCETLHLTPDGGTIICATQYGILGADVTTNAGCANGGLKFIAYSASTGKTVRVLYQYRGACESGLFNVLWTDASATDIIGVTEVSTPQESGKQVDQLGVITNSDLRPFKLPKTIPQPNYSTLAF